MLKTRMTKEEKKVLLALVEGYTLKSHRYMDGTKLYKLHPLEGQPQDIRQKTIASLREQGLIQSNQKFPAASYLLTDKGKNMSRKISLKNTI